jgi:hypothetical protein
MESRSFVLPTMIVDAGISVEFRRRKRLDVLAPVGKILENCLVCPKGFSPMLTDSVEPHGSRYPSVNRSVRAFL